MNIDSRLVLDLGASYSLSNHPDALAKRVVLAQLLVTTRLVRSMEAGLLAFRIWNTEGARNHELQTIYDLANEKARQ